MLVFILHFPPLGYSDHVAVSISIDFPTNSKEDELFHCIAYEYSCADWDSLHDHLRDVSWEDIFKLSASAAAASEFCKWVQVGIDAYISHRKYQFKPHSSPCFSAAYAAVVVHRNHFFRLHHRINLLNLKLSSNRLVIIAKGFLKLPNLHMLRKQKILSLPRNFALGTFGKLLIVFSKKLNLLYLLYSTALSCCLLHLIKQNYLLKPFQRTLILMNRVSHYHFPF